MRSFVCLHLSLAFAVLILALAGCGGARVIPIGESIRDADRQFDAAEAFLIQANRDTEQDKRREQIEQKKILYDEALNAYRAIVITEPTGNYSQRSLWQISEIYSRRYNWDKVIESYNAITAIAPLSYYGDRAKSAIADMLRCREQIEEARLKYRYHCELYAQDNARENYDLVAQALYEVAKSYEELGDYPEAITHYQRMVDEFPDYEKASAALTKIGEIHFYELYDYLGGWPVYNKVIEMYPDSYDATYARRLLKETDRTLTEIAQNQAEIRRYRSESVIDYIPTDRRIISGERYVPRINNGIIVQCYQFIGRHWEDLRNYPSAIVAYRTLADELSYKKFAAADARYQIGRLYQLNGQINQAIDAYQELFDKNPESVWCAEGIYQQAVCYRGIREFNKAYEGFKAYMNLGRNVEYYREAEQFVRQFETEKDRHRSGTSDEDPNGHQSVKSLLIRIFQGKTGE